MLNLDDAKYLHHDVLYSSFSPNEKDEILKYVKTCPISSAEINSLYNHFYQNVEVKYHEFLWY